MSKMSERKKTVANSATPLAKGNRALVDGDFALALGSYLEAMAAIPEFGRMAAVNIALTRIRYRQSRAASKKTRVAICCKELFNTKSRRIDTLVGTYDGAEAIDLIDWTFASRRKANPALATRPGVVYHPVSLSSPDRFIEQTLQFIAAHPCDILHLSGCHAPSLLIGIFYMLVWNALVFVDIDHDELGETKASSLEAQIKALKSLPVLAELGDREWHLLAIAAAEKLDGVTVSSAQLQQKFGGFILKEESRSKWLWQQFVRQQRTERKPVNTVLQLLPLTPGSPYAELLALAEFPCLHEVVAVKAQPMANVVAEEKPAADFAPAVVSTNHSEEQESHTVDWQAERAKPRLAGAATLIIPVFAGQKMAQRCIETLYQCTPIDLFELVVMAIGCGDSTNQQLKLLAAQHPNMKVVVETGKLSFAETANRAILYASNEFVVIIGQDVMLTPGWLEPLLKSLADPEVAVSQPFVLNPDNTVLDIGTVFGADSPDARSIYGGMPLKDVGVATVRAYQVTRAVVFAFRAKDQIDARGFDEELAGSIDECKADFCLRLNSAGYRRFESVRHAIVFDHALSPRPAVTGNPGASTFSARWAKKLVADESACYERDGVVVAGWKTPKQPTTTGKVPVLRKAEVPAVEPLTVRRRTEAQSIIIQLQNRRLRPWQRVLQADGQELGVVGGAAESADISSEQAIAQVAQFIALSGRPAATDIRFKSNRYDVNSNLNGSAFVAQTPAIAFATPFTDGSSIVDAWFCNEYMLRLRTSEPAGIDGHSCSDAALAVYQYCNVTGKLKRCSVMRDSGNAIGLVDIALCDSFMPLLVCETDVAGVVLHVSILPFPSLVRGGVHYAELWARALGGNYLADLFAASVALLEAWASVKSGKSVGTTGLVVDVAAGNGSELLLSPPVQQWLQRVFSVHTRLQPQADGVPVPATFDYLQSMVMPVASNMATSGCWLHLPVHAVPTIEALVNTDSITREGMRTGAWLVAKAVSNEPLRMLKMPALRQELLPAAPGRAFEFPVIGIVNGKPSTSKNLIAECPQFPLSIHFAAETQISPATVVYPVAPDCAVGLRSKRGKPSADIAAIITSRGSLELLEELVIALARQQGANLAAIDVVCTDDLERLQSHVKKLARHTSAQIRFHNDGGNRKYQSLHGSLRELKADCLLFVDDSVLLHDPGTLAMLASLCVQPGVASVASQLVREPSGEKGSEWQLCFGGFVSAGRKGTEPEPLTVSGIPVGCTYPVAANSSAFYMMASAVWQQLAQTAGGAATTLAADEGKSLPKGYVNLCTALVTATLRLESSTAKMTVSPFWTDSQRSLQMRPVIPAAVVAKS